MAELEYRLTYIQMSGQPGGEQIFETLKVNDQLHLINQEEQPEPEGTIKGTPEKKANSEAREAGLREKLMVSKSAREQARAIAETEEIKRQQDHDEALRTRDLQAKANVEPVEAEDEPASDLAKAIIEPLEVKDESASNLQQEADTFAAGANPELNKNTIQDVMIVIKEKLARSIRVQDVGSAPPKSVTGAYEHDVKLSPIENAKNQRGFDSLGPPLF